MKKHSMTEWDAGQDLIACADLLAKKEKCLREGGYRKLADVVREARFAIGRAFNEHNSHDFGLSDGFFCFRAKRKRKR
jgi:hypothetical protein